MSNVERNKKNFRRAILFSLVAHAFLFLLISVSPSLPRASSKGMIHYLPLNLASFPGSSGGGGNGRGGSGGDGGKKIEEPPKAKKETIRDLTTIQKLKEEPKSSLSYPTKKPIKGKTPVKEKKAAISKPEKSAPENVQTKNENTDSTQGSSTGMGSGVRIGAGDGSGDGGGFGSSYSSQIGLSNFPFTYYLQIIMDRVSANWFTSLVDPGVSGNFQSTVYFKIYKNGQVSDLKVEESSGIKSLDLSAIRAIQTSSPFPPLPKDYEEEYLGIHLIFEHSK